MDKALDGDAGKNHGFLQTGEKLIKLKEANPKMRLSGPTPLRETIVCSEEEMTGLKAPKRSFMELAKYEEKHGPAAPDQIKTITFRGKKMRGVDVIKAEDVDCICLDTDIFF